jgi:hypothetical protein
MEGQYVFSTYPYTYREKQNGDLAIELGKNKKYVEFLFLSVYDFKKSKKGLRVPRRNRNLQD